MRFLKGLIDGLKDLPRKGRPCVIPPEVKTKVFNACMYKTPDGSNQWTRRLLTKTVGIGKTTVHRILTQGNIKPHKVEYWCGKSPDPEFEEKQVAILGLYLNPPENALVLCVDEKSQLQPLTGHNQNSPYVLAFLNDSQLHINVMALPVLSPVFLFMTGR
jgi:hypothetical protein